ncbi:MAG: primosomal protein N' [Armatimonadetes bacterium]|nr:primosomal protein N' [Armatimonadota bacterium]
METLRVAEIIIDSRVGGSGAQYTYQVDEDLPPGTAVVIPLGSRKVLGYVLRTWIATQETLGFPVSRLRRPEGIVREASLPPQTMQLVQFVAEEYGCPVSAALTVATPPGVLSRLTLSYRLSGKASTERLSAVQEETLQLFKESGGTFDPPAKLAPALGKALQSLERAGLIEKSLTFKPTRESKSREQLYRLSAHRDDVEKFLKNEGRKRPAQALVLMRLGMAADSAFSVSEIKAMCGVTDTILRPLVEGGLLEVVQQDESLQIPAPKPNPFQQLAIDAVCAEVTAQQYHPYLLYGITGSGKTEVYLAAAGEALRLGRQVLFLVPEIALATQGISRLRERFGKGVALVHSDMAEGERLKTFSDIAGRRTNIVLGARSALFAPLQNIGLIVMDEEHEGSYKQETTPRYHAKTVAMQLAKIHGCPIVLGSATPSVESFAEAQDNELTLLSLPERANALNLPQVETIDLRETFHRGSPALITTKLQDAIKETLAKKQQVILFLNRRAYSPFVLCRDCGHKEQCPNCSVTLSYHKRTNRLKCHHCGFNKRPPDTCPSCGGNRISALGVGTEKVEETIRELFPEARVARLDRDIAQRKGALEEILADFRAGETDILIGTQMVAKGLDFPNVTLVGVILADISLNMPDFRATERTFQLLTQVAGRAGRGKFPGEVFIQTFTPDHPAVQRACQHDYIGFFEAAREERKDVGYPPFRRLVNIVFSGEHLSEVRAAATEAAAKIKAAMPDAEIRGPVDCPLEKLQTKWRWHLLLRLKPHEQASKVSEVLEDLNSKTVQVMVDIDPYSML